MTNESLLSQLQIKINGQTPAKALADSIEQILVETSLHLPSVATIIIHDPALEWLDHTSLEPGKTLTISPDGGATLFDGEIVEVEADLGVEGQHVIVRAFDRLHRLSRGVHTRAFKEVSDADIVGTCAGDVGMSKECDDTPGQHAYFIQANESNLSLLQRRAAAHGYLLYANGSKLCFKAPATAGPIAVELGTTLITFRPRLSAAGYLQKTTVRGWDPKTKQPIVGESQTSTIVPSVGLTFKDYLALKPIGRVSNLSVQDQNVAEKMAQGLTDAYVSRYIEAEGVCLGNAALKAGSTLETKNVGTRFSGTYFVTSASHRLVPGESYLTEFSVTGLNPSTVLSMLNPTETSHEPLGNLTIGIITDNKDPDKLGRVKLKLPLLLDEKTSQDLQTDWVRLAAAGAGAKRGMFFLPEVNDEVLVAFGQGDVNMAFVIGFLWNTKDTLPGDTAKHVGSDGKVNQRIIYSRTGHYIMLDDSDADGGISIVDKKANKIVLKAQDNTLTVEFAGDVTMTTKANLSIDVSGNATMKAKGNFAIEAQGNLSLKASGNLNAEATGNLTAEAMGQAGFKGTAGAKVESSAIVTVQGSMINLN